MESNHRTYRRSDGTLGVGFVIKFADCSQACIAWPDTVPERIYTHQLAQGGVEDVTDEMPKAAVTIETRQLLPTAMFMRLTQDIPLGRKDVAVSAVGLSDGQPYQIVSKSGVLGGAKAGYEALFTHAEGEWVFSQGPMFDADPDVKDTQIDPPAPTPEVIQSNNEYIAQNLADDDTKEFPLPDEIPEASADAPAESAPPSEPETTDERKEGPVYIKPNKASKKAKDK